MVKRPPSAAWAAALYDGVWAAALPLVFARFWWRGRAEPIYRQRWPQRLGHWPHLPPPVPGHPRVWVHAVSLGETRAASALVQALRRHLPRMQLLLTTGTATGWSAGQDLLQAGDLQGWVPLDTPSATRRFFEHTQPQAGVLLETETWPNLLAQAHAAGVPVVLANARLSERSLRKGQRWSALSIPMMAGLSAAWAQTAGDAERLVQAGAVPERVAVMGNLKYDLQPDPDLLARGAAWASPAGRRVVMAASWREGEDEALIEAWRDATAGVAPGRMPLLMVVPRHPQRFDAVQALWAQAGFRVSRRSAWSPSPTPQDEDAQVWLGDSVGEMPAYYAAADVALLGGSFAPLGGQNLIEAAACACPLIMGPHTFNFEEAARLSVTEGSAVRVGDVREAVHRALSMSDAELQAQADAGRAFSARHAGAADRQAQALAELIRSSTTPTTLTERTMKGPSR